MPARSKAGWARRCANTPTRPASASGSPPSSPTRRSRRTSTRSRWGSAAPPHSSAVRRVRVQRHRPPALRRGLQGGTRPGTARARARGRAGQLAPAAELDLFGQPFDAPAAASGGRSPKFEVRSSKSEARAPATRSLHSRISDRRSPIADGRGQPGTPDPAGAALRTLDDTPHHYELVDTREKLASLVTRLAAQPAFCSTRRLTDWIRKPPGLGIAFQLRGGERLLRAALPGKRPGLAVMRSDDQPPGGARLLRATAQPLAGRLGRASPHQSHPVDEERRRARDGRGPAGPGARARGPARYEGRAQPEFDLLVLQWQGIEVCGPLFDTMIAHALIEPEQRHGMDYCAEVYLGYSPIPIERLIGLRARPSGAWRCAGGRGRRLLAQMRCDRNSGESSFPCSRNEPRNACFTKSRCGTAGHRGHAVRGHP